MNKERETLITDLSINTVDGFFYITRKLQAEIQELLAQPEQEPEAWILEDKKTGYRRQSAYKPTDLDEEACNVIPLYTAPPVKSEQEPVAWKVIDGPNGEFMFSRVKPMQRTYKYDVVIPLYSAPISDITGEELMKQVKTNRVFYQEGYAQAERDLKREPLGLEIMDACGSEDYREGFKDGALYAEKCHGITGGE